MKPKSETEVLARLDEQILTIRGQKVILDVALAGIYGVQTKALNQAVRRNADRFPDDFSFRLTAREWRDLKSQSGTSSSEASPRERVEANRSQFVTGSQQHRDPRSLPHAFTEHGAMMAANVLNSPRAAQMSVFVVRAFVRMRALLAGDLVTHPARAQRVTHYCSGVSQLEVTKCDFKWGRSLARPALHLRQARRLRSQFVTLRVGVELPVYV